jgi:hypothetical protein
MSQVYNCSEVGPNCPPEGNWYGYAPSLPANAVLLAIFGLCFLIHSFQAIYYRTIGFGIALFLGTVSLIIGYIGRIMMHYNAYSYIGFMIQVCCLAIAPAFISAGIYLTLSRIVRVFGEDISRIRAKYYFYIFIVCDIISLSLQGKLINSHSRNLSDS